MTNLVFATGPVRLGADGDRLREGLGDVLGRELGVGVRVVASHSYADLFSRLARGEVHLAWMSPALALRAVDALRAEPLVRSVRAHGAQFYGVLFARGDARIRRLEDVRGVRVAWVDRDSCSGYLFPRLALSAAGLPLGGLFREERIVGSHEAVARAVVSGEADVGATYYNVVVDEWDESEVAAGWSDVTMEPMRVLLRTEAIPADLVLASAAVEPSVRARARAVLAGLHEHGRAAPQVRGIFGAERFDVADLRDYDVVRRALVASEAAPGLH
jgi:phosphonate transport system substrate-binding protein